MAVTSSLLFDDVCRRGSIRHADVKQLRRLYYANGEICRREAECLFEINDACKIQDPSWPEFFQEAIVDYVVHQNDPQGYVDIAKSDWLVVQTAPNGEINTHSGLQLLIRVMELARWSPESLSQFVLNAIKDSILTGSPIARGGRGGIPGVVAREDVELLRRVLYAFGGAGNIAVTRGEAEILFRINDATAEAENDPDWTELFVKATLNVLLEASGYVVPTREDALRRENWLESRGDLSWKKVVAGMMTPRIASQIGTMIQNYRKPTSDEWQMSRLEQERHAIITQEVITRADADWLARQVERDGRLTLNECVLLMHLKRARPKLHPRLQRVVDHAETLVN